MKYLLLVIALSHIAASAESTPDVSIYLPTTKRTLHLNLVPKGPRDKNYLQGIDVCPEETTKFIKSTGTTQCLVFHTWFSRQPLVYVPVVELNAAQKSGEELPVIYAGSGINVRQSTKKDFRWGAVYFWSTDTIGSTHYVYLENKKSDRVVRIGPIAGTVLSRYDIDFGKAQWR